MPNCVFLRNPPAVAAQRVHQLHRPLDELGRLVDLLDRLAPVRTRDNHAVAAVGAVVADFITELLAVLVEEPDHPARKPTTTRRTFLCDEIARRAQLFTR